MYLKLKYWTTGQTVQFINIICVNDSLIFVMPVSTLPVSINPIPSRNITTPAGAHTICICHGNQNNALYLWVCEQPKGRKYKGQKLQSMKLDRRDCSKRFGCISAVCAFFFSPTAHTSPQVGLTVHSHCACVLAAPLCS